MTNAIEKLRERAAQLTLVPYWPIFKKKTTICKVREIRSRNGEKIYFTNWVKFTPRQLQFLANWPIYALGSILPSQFWQQLFWLVLAIFFLPVFAIYLFPVLTISCLAILVLVKYFFAILYYTDSVILASLRKT